MSKDKLTDSKLRTAKPEGKEYNLGDGDGLYLRVKTNGGKLWLFNYYRPGDKRRANLSFGPYPDVTLSAARERRRQARALLAEGIDPQLHQQEQVAIAQAKQEASANTFEASTLWPWIANHVDIDPELHACIQKYCDAQKSANETTVNSTQENKPADDTQSVEQVTALAEKVAELTERLQQAEAEIAALKGRAPTFRHMTPALRLVAEVQERYWGDNWEPNTVPKQFTILHELENTHGLSNAKAKNVEYVASPIDRVTGKNLCSSQIEP